MSLVDYASSSDEDEPKHLVQEELVNAKIPETRQPFGAREPVSHPNNDQLHSQIRLSASPRPSARPSSKQMEIISNNSSELKLPDASLLFNSPDMPSNLLNSSDHSSRVAAAMVENTARKRELNAKASSYPRNKVPKGNLHHMKSSPDTVDGHLLPPQLIGRSNVVTEDIGKLFVRKHTTS